MHNDIKELFLKSLAEQGKSAVYSILENLVCEYPKEMAVALVVYLEHTKVKEYLAEEVLDKDFVDEQTALEILEG